MASLLVIEMSNAFTGERDILQLLHARCRCRYIVALCGNSIIDSPHVRKRIAVLRCCDCKPSPELLDFSLQLFKLPIVHIISENSMLCI